MRPPQIFWLIGLLAALTLFSGCSASDFEKTNRSEAGILAEEAFPVDTWFLISFSTLDEQQRTYFQQFTQAFSQDADAFSQQFLEGIDANLDVLNLSYIEDIQPILGEEGTRFVFGLSEGGGDKPFAHAALTLRDNARAQELLNTLEREGRFVKKKVEEYDFYFNPATAASKGEVFYFTLYEDVFLISNSDDELSQMIHLLRSEEDASLWTKELYREVVKDLPKEHVGMLFMDGEMLVKDNPQVPNSLLSYLKAQGLALVATEKGLELRGIAQANRAKIKEDDADLAPFKVKPIYLYKDMPSKDLALYLESYNFASVLKRRFGDEGGRLENLKNLLGVSEMDFDQFLGEGYSIALHRGLGLLPAVTLLFDVSGDPEAAQTFVESVDGKLSSLIALFQFQGGAIAEALSKEDVALEGGEFHLIRLDVDQVMSLYDPGQAFELPENLKGQKMTLIYGTTEDKRLLISTYEGWLADPQEMLADDPLYQETLRELKGYDRGLVYASLQELKQYMKDFEAIREALRSEEAMPEEASIEAVETESTTPEVPVEGAETEETASASETTETEVEEVSDSDEPSKLEQFDAEKWLGPLKSFAFSSDLGWYQVELGGVVLLKEESEEE